MDRDIDIGLCDRYTFIVQDIYFMVSDIFHFPWEEIIFIAFSTAY